MDAAGGADAPTAPPAPPPANPAGSVRYVYLIGRLRNRAITMEEATELFSVMQGMIRQAQALAVAPTATTPGVPTPAPSGASVPMSEDLYWIGLLGMGAAAGLGAALLRRASGLPPAAPPGRRRSTSSG